jgi:hypothetical protein
VSFVSTRPVLMELVPLLSLQQNDSGNRHALHLQPRVDASTLRCGGHCVLSPLTPSPFPQGIDNEVPISELTISQVRDPSSNFDTSRRLTCIASAGVCIGTRAILALIPQLIRTK